jgi:hypothetical protein
VALFIGGRYGARKKSRDDGLFQPLGKRGIEETVLDEIGGPCL